VNLRRYLMRVCTSRPAGVARAGRMLAWIGWAAILFGVVRKSAAPTAMHQFDLVLSGWWIPENISGFLVAAASMLAGLALCASAQHFEYSEGKKT
jgi:hypothetical protein